MKQIVFSACIFRRKNTLYFVLTFCYDLSAPFSYQEINKRNVLKALYPLLSSIFTYSANIFFIEFNFYPLFSFKEI